MKIVKTKGVTFALAALMALPLAVASAPSAHAQTAYQQAMGNRGGGGGFRAMSTVPGALDGTGTGTTSTDPDYTDTFAGVTTEATNAITGPGKLAIGVMILGVIFSVVWRLVGKAGKAIGR